MNLKKERMQTKIAALKREIERMEANRKLTYQRITKVDAARFAIVNENFISVRCETVQEMRNVLTNLLPFKNAWKIEHTKVWHLTSLYRIDLSSNVVSGDELKIEFENATGIKYWVTLNVTKLPFEFRENYFRNSTRRPTSSERHYNRFHGVSDSQYAKIEIPYTTFKNVNVTWYGGNCTSICEDTIAEMINDIKNV